MNHIHPFPARMAPSIALERLVGLPTDSVVLDPMCGSGMVVSQAAKTNIRSIGCDIDPLARILSRVASTRVDERKVWRYFQELLKFCDDNSDLQASPNWIENDIETKKFIDYWFAEKQQRQLKLVSLFLAETNSHFRAFHKNVLAVALSRLIITKNPKASLARDTAHSRPHRTITENDFDIFENLESSLAHVIKAIQPDNVLMNSKVYHDDARKLKSVSDDSVDSVITSPPYLNAIDYMRGHKFSLVWLGYQIGQLRKIRARTIGTERFILSDGSSEFDSLLQELELSELDQRAVGMLRRYYFDLKKQLIQIKRVLKVGRPAHFVIGNSSIKGHFVQNSELLKFAAKKIGFSLVSEIIREIPDNRRYLPISVSSTNSLAGRMRTEHVIEFAN